VGVGVGGGGLGFARLVGRLDGGGGGKKRGMEEDDDEGMVFCVGSTESKVRLCIHTFGEILFSFMTDWVNEARDAKISKTSERTIHSPNSLSFPFNLLNNSFSRSDHPAPSSDFTRTTPSCHPARAELISRSKGDDVEGESMSREGDKRARFRERVVVVVAAAEEEEFL